MAEYREILADTAGGVLTITLNRPERLNAWTGTMQAEVETAIRRAQAAYQEGNVPIFIVLETTRQLLDNYLREAILVADLRRFWAELERSVGRRLATAAGNGQ